MSRYFKGSRDARRGVFQTALTYLATIGIFAPIALLASLPTPEPIHTAKTFAAAALVGLLVAILISWTAFESSRSGPALLAVALLLTWPGTTSRPTVSGARLDPFAVEHRYVVIPCLTLDASVWAGHAVPVAVVIQVPVGLPTVDSGGASLCLSSSAQGSPQADCRAVMPPGWLPEFQPFARVGPEAAFIDIGDTGG